MKKLVAAFAVLFCVAMLAGCSKEPVKPTPGGKTTPGAGGGTTAPKAS